tara:strand:+ start:426 stop:719 length:294 start_codon:yes stop_codon:yes gene_type:complete
MKICPHCNQEIKKKKLETFQFEIEKKDTYSYEYKVNVDKVLEDYDCVESFKESLLDKLHDEATDDSEALVPYDWNKYFEESNCYNNSFSELAISDYS